MWDILRDNMSTSLLNGVFNDLYEEFGWIEKNFAPAVQSASDEFFFEGLRFKLISISQNMNILSQNETFFVTKIKINKKSDVFIRISQETINVILDKVLGRANKNFELTEVSELEARIITTFNDFLYEKIKSSFNIDKEKKYTEILHLTFLVKNELSEDAAKFIISLPRDILTPPNRETKAPRIQESFLANALVEVNFILGSTRFPLADIKALDTGDIVVCDNSKANIMHLIVGNKIIKDVKIKPDMKLVVPLEANGGNEMNEENTNLWDSIQVDMTAVFEKVKIPLGELKNIEEGIVVDISSVYDNKVYLQVGGKTVAYGDLVIINDRYGVKIDGINPQAEGNTDTAVSDFPNPEPAEEIGAKEEFDYSDFDPDS